MYPDNTSRERHIPHLRQRGILPFLSAVRRFQPSSLLDADYRRNLLNQIGGSAFNNNLPVASNASYTGGTPLPSSGGSQSSFRPPLYAHNEAEAYSPNSYSTSAEEQMIQAAIEASMHEVACKLLIQEYMLMENHVFFFLLSRALWTSMCIEMSWWM